jgi:hypothetical protein
MEKVVNMDASYSVLAAATRLMVEQNDKEAAKKYAEWGSIKARLLKKDGAYFRNVL